MKTVLEFEGERYELGPIPDEVRPVEIKQRLKDACECDGGLPEYECCACAAAREIGLRDAALAECHKEIFNLRDQLLRTPVYKCQTCGNRRRHGTARTNPYGNLGKVTRELIDQIRAVKGKEPQMATAARTGMSHAAIRYWQKSTHYPHAPSMTPQSIKRRNISAAMR